MTTKQVSLHSPAPAKARLALCGALCAFGIVGQAPAGWAQTKVMPQTGGEMSVLRLVSAGGLRNGKYEAGVDLTMAPGSHTYWKIPGESGVPPVFTFNGSENVASATVSFPVPSRITEEGIDAFGYDNAVVFPVDVTPADRSKPSVLHVDVSYAVCNKICLPGHGEAKLTLSPHGAAVGGDDVARALAKVPRAIASAPELKIIRVADRPDPTWTLVWNGTDAPSDIFPEAPEGFFFDTKKVSPATWTLTAERSVIAPKAQTAPVTLVLARVKGSTSVTETFDVGAPGK